MAFIPQLRLSNHDLVYVVRVNYLYRALSDLGDLGQTKASASCNISRVQAATNVSQKGAFELPFQRSVPLVSYKLSSSWKHMDIFSQLETSWP